MWYKELIILRLFDSSHKSWINDFLSLYLSLAFSAARSWPLFTHTRSRAPLNVNASMRSEISKYRNVLFRWISPLATKSVQRACSALFVRFHLARRQQRVVRRSIRYWMWKPASVISWVTSEIRIIVKFTLEILQNVDRKRETEILRECNGPGKDGFCVQYTGTVAESPTQTGSWKCIVWARHTVYIRKLYLLYAYMTM